MLRKENKGQGHKGSQTWGLYKNTHRQVVLFQDQWEKRHVAAKSFAELIRSKTVCSIWRGSFPGLEMERSLLSPSKENTVML